MTRQVTVNKTFGRYADVAAHFSEVEDASKPSCAELYLDECRSLGIKPNSAILEQLPKVRGVYSMDGINCAVNFIGEKGVRALFPLIRVNSKITRLILRDNGLTNATAKDLCKVLEGLPDLHTLDLSSNAALSIDAGMAVLNLVKRLKRLTRVGLQHTAISKELQTKISAMAAANLRANPSQGAEQRSQLLPKKQFLMIKEIFDRLDPDGDGTVAFGEFRDNFLLHTASLQPKEKAELQGLFACMDVDKSGRLGFIEFLKSAFPQLTLEEIYHHIDIYSTIEVVEVASDDPVELLTPDEIEEIQAVFRSYDTNGDNFLTIQELKTRLSKSWLVADVGEIFQQCDANGDQKLDLEEFTRLMAISYHPEASSNKPPANIPNRAPALEKPSQPQPKPQTKGKKK
eukprot:TRINITY_DN5506_c0_g1_i1.p2 TRINITY_DN5506_c0_g1~~TRINITY_DN5506_c0_g1_i1.p2  ORF type:complete len:401 (+),score=75.41 TRINITY_DN5506_c0_g1_i1:197-1399(+)